MRPWDALSDEEKRLFCRMAEVYAGFSEYTDHQVGRIVDYLEESGQLDNTLILYCADNGASGEGSPNGSVNENKFFNAWPDTIEDNLPLIDKLGGPGGLQPLPDRLGGRVLDAVPDVQALLVPGRRRATRSSIHWPAGIAGARRGAHQYHHCTDIVPTILDCCGVEMPDVVDGVEQTPLPGVSMRYSFDDADAPTQQGDPVLRDARHARHLAQGLEGGRRARAGPAQPRASSTRTAGSSSTPTRTAPRRTTSPSSTPRSSKELDGLWLEEAKKYDVLPLNDLGDLRVPRRSSTRSPVPAERAVHLLPGHDRGAGGVGGEHASTSRTRSSPRSSSPPDVAGRDRRPGLALRRLLAVRQGRQAPLRLQLPRHPARAADRRRRADAPGTHIVGVEFTKERDGRAPRAARAAEAATSTTRSSPRTRSARSRRRYSPLRRGAVHRLRRRRRGQQRVQAEVRVHRRPRS